MQKLLLTPIPALLADALGLLVDVLVRVALDPEIEPGDERDR